LRAVPDILVSLVREAKAETAARRARISLDELDGEAAAREPVRDFAAALAGPRLGVIAEMKRRTPTMGVLAESYEPARLAEAYATGGAVALSVLTHEAGFGGSPAHLSEAGAAADLPVLRKDFITDEYQVVEARAHGADAVLLIAAVLPLAALESLLGAARRLGMEALVETHDAAEVEAALVAGAHVIGVNHRDLRTFEVDPELTARLRPLVLEDRLLVAESGIHSGEDARRMRDAGADAILVGEALMRAPDPAAKLRELAATI
jgi:indole-3-glycerol phosphate synthase